MIWAWEKFQALFVLLEITMTEFEEAEADRAYWEIIARHYHLRLVGWNGRYNAQFCQLSGEAFSFFIPSKELADRMIEVALYSPSSRG